MYKTDFKLGEEIHLHLKENGVETPMIVNEETEDEKLKKVSQSFLTIMQTLGLNLDDDSLKDTPARVAKMYVKEVFYGLNYNLFPKCTTVENKMKYDEMVIVDNATVMSNCEHHFVTIHGTARVGYIPKNRVLGLSKINRVVEFFSKRPQIQERLTEQIYYALSYILNTEDVAVMIDADHYCVKSRGVQDLNSKTRTTKLGGAFKRSEVRHEFLK